MATLASQLRTIWQKLALKSVFQETDKRRLQQEIDVHRLFLFTSFYRLNTSTDEGIKGIIDLAEKTPFERQQEEVQANVHGQVCHLADVLNEILMPVLAKSVEPVLEKRTRPSGLSFAVHGLERTSKHKKVSSHVETNPYSKAQVSTLLREKIGYTLELKSSKIFHSEAGEGLFLNGTVRPGAVVSLYPGVTYSPSQYRYIPGYPRVDVDNPYLISRYDGAIIDGKPWGRGGESREWFDGSEEGVDRALYDDNRSRKGHVHQSDRFGRKPSPSWWKMLGGQQITSLRKGEILELRNPLALAHFANHPPKGELPNVMVCSCDFREEDAHLRPYIPNVPFADEELDMQRRGMIWVNEGRKSEFHGDTQHQKNQSVIRGLVLVATREIKDEELLLNYRLSNFKNRPSWYHAIDEEEDKRRWS